MREEDEDVERSGENMSESDSNLDHLTEEAKAAHRILKMKNLGSRFNPFVF